MPDLPLARTCAIVLLVLSGCGEDLVLLDGELWATGDPLTISGQVLDGEGRPLWGVVVTAVDQRTNRPPVVELDADGSLTPPRSSSDTYGDYTIELDALGPTWLHFGHGGRTFAWIEVDAGSEQKVDVVLAEDDVVHCQMFGEHTTISSYSMWATGPNHGYGMGGGCISSHGTCGPATISFIWPTGYEQVEVHLGDTEIELSGWDQPCEATE